MERFERWNSRRQQPDAGRQRAALVMDVDAVPAQPFALKTEIDRLAPLQLVELRRIEQRNNRGPDVFRIECGA